MIQQDKMGCMLRSLRKEKGLTQEQLAEHFGISNRTISRWENGINMPDISVLVEIAEFYEVGILELIEGERTQEKMETDNNNQLKKIAEYSDKQNHMMISKINKRDIVALIFCIIACIGITLFTGYRNVITLLSILVALAVTLVMIIYNISVTTGLDKKRRDFEKKHPRIGYAYIALLIFFAFSVVKDVLNIMHLKL